MGMHRLTEPRGENHLCGNEVRLWELTYSCLLHYQCPVIFNVHGPNAPLRIDQHIRFFVPRDNPKADAVKAYLQKELADDVREGQVLRYEDRPEEYYWGVSVEILEFDGVGFYIDREQTKAMSESWLNAFKARLEGLIEGSNNVKH